MKQMLINLKLNKEVITQALKSMVEESKGTKKVKLEELISRFRSKEDLYLDFTQ